MKEGEINVFCGPVASGKTTSIHNKLVRDADTLWKCQPNKIQCAFINNKLDTRSEFISTNSSLDISISKRIDYIKLDNLNSFDVSKYSMIAIDEAHFFPNLTEYVLYWANVLNKVIYIAALDGDYLSRSFDKVGPNCSNVADLLQNSTRFVKLSANCQICYDRHEVKNKAIFSHRIVEKGEGVNIGGEEMYRPLCRHHYNLLNGNIFNNTPPSSPQ